MAANRLRLRWQRDSVMTLAQFFMAAGDLGLPAITWTIAATGTITGRVDRHDRTPEQQRAAFQAWAGYLDSPVSEHACKGGRTVLTVRFLTKDMLVEGIVRADIAPPAAKDGGDL